MGYEFTDEYSNEVAVEFWYSSSLVNVLRQHHSSTHFEYDSERIITATLSPEFENSKVTK